MKVWIAREDLPEERFWERTLLFTSRPHCWSDEAGLRWSQTELGDDHEAELGDNSRSGGQFGLKSGQCVELNINFRELIKASLSTNKRML